MIKRLLFVATFCLSIFEAKAQIITIIDNETNSGLSSVLVFNETRTIVLQSNFAGQLNISEFPSEDTVYFKLVGYKELKQPISELNRVGEIVMERELFSLDEIVVSSNRWLEEGKHVPQQIFRIETSEMKKTDPQTTADILANSGEIFVQKSQLGGGSPMLRGFAANKILLSLDGIRMNNAIYRSGNLQNIITVDGNSLDGMEVILGPGSVIYGSDALGGVISMHTRNPELSIDSTTTVFGDAFARASSANREFSMGFQVNIGGNKWASLTNFSGSVFGDLRSGGLFDSRDPDFGKRTFYVDRINNRDTIVQSDDFTLQQPSGYRQANLMQKVRYKASRNLDIQYTLLFSTTSDIPRYDRLTETDGILPENAEWYYGPQLFVLNGLKFEFNGNKYFNRGRVNVAHQRVVEERNDRKFQDDFLRKRTETVDAISLNADFHSKPDNRNEFNYGLEGVLNLVNSEAIETNILTNQTQKTATRYPDGGNTYYSAAAYLNYIRFLSSNLTFNSGVRYTYVGLESQFSDTTFYPFPYSEINLSNGSFSGAAGLSRHWKSGSKLYFNLSSGFRAPNLDDVAKVFDSEPGRVVVPNPDLEPEYVYTADLGFQFKFLEKFALFANVYYSILDNAIIRANSTVNGQDSIVYDGELSQVQSEQNLGQANIAGTSIRLEWNITRPLTLRSTLTYTWGEDSEGNALRHVAPLFGRTGITWAKNDWEVEFFSLYSGGIAFEDLAPSEQDKPHIYSEEGALSWMTFNARIAKRIKEKFELQFIAENLEDRHYRPYSSGISAPGLNFRLSARAFFN